MDQPWAWVGFGLLVSALAGFLVFLGLEDDGTPGLVIAGWVFGGIGSLLLFVGLIALGVEIGVRAARR